MFLVTFCWFVPARDLFIRGMERPISNGSLWPSPSLHPYINQNFHYSRTEDVQHVDGGVLAGHVQHRDVEVDADLGLLLIGGHLAG